MKQQLEIGGKQIDVGLDRFVLSMPYPKKLNEGAVSKLSVEQIGQYLFEKDEFVTRMHFVKNMIIDHFKHHVLPTKYKDLKRYNVFFDDGGLMFVLTAGFCFGTGVLNIEINPSKLNQKQLMELINWLNDLFSYGYQEFYNKSMVSHAEFFVDVADVDISELVLLDDTRRISTRFEGNTYLGKRESPKITVMYNKAKQLKLNQKLVRVEARINPKSLRFKDLVEGNPINPFGNDLVVNVNQVQLIANAFGKSKFANRIKEFGFNGSGINKHTRKIIFEKLKQNTVSWWVPDLFWTIQKNQLKQFSAINCQSFIY